MSIPGAGDRGPRHQITAKMAVLLAVRETHRDAGRSRKRSPRTDCRPTGTSCPAVPGVGRRPSRRLKLIGVAGQSGKTTTSCLIAGVLTAAGYRTGVMGPLGYLDGRGIEPATHATPPPERLALLLARMADTSVPTQ